MLHEILPVSSGMRVSLAYNLYKEDIPGSAKSLSCVDVPVHRLLSEHLKVINISKLVDLCMF